MARCNPIANIEHNIETLFARCEGAYSQNTLRGYRNDLLQFQKWCAANDNEWFPAEPATIAAYVDEEVETKAVATIKHRLDAIRFAHVMADLPCPTDHSEVRLAVRRAKRTKAARPKQALGLTSDILGRMLAACPDTLLGRRDAALLSVGYDTLCRSSELGTRNNHSFAGALRRIEHPVRKIGGLNDLSSASPDTFRSLSASLAAFGRAYPVAAFLSWKIRRSKL